MGFEARTVQQAGLSLYRLKYRGITNSFNTHTQTISFWNCSVFNDTWQHSVIKVRAGPKNVASMWINQSVIFCTKDGVVLKIEKMSALCLIVLSMRMQDFVWGNLSERDHLEDPGVDGRIILRWTFRKWYGGTEWIELAQDRDRLRTLVNTVMNIRVP